MQYDGTVNMHRIPMINGRTFTVFMGMCHQVWHYETIDAMNTCDADIDNRFRYTFTYDKDKNCIKRINPDRDSTQRWDERCIEISGTGAKSRILHGDYPVQIYDRIKNYKYTL